MYKMFAVYSSIFLYLLNHSKINANINEITSRIFENPIHYNIGAVLSSGDNIIEFSQVIEDINYKPGIHPGVTLYAVTVPMNANPIRTAQSVCDKLISSQVYAVIVSHPTNGEQSPASVSFTCGFYNIPVIGISNRDSSLSNKNLHASFIRTIPPYSHQADVWIEILKELKYYSVVFIHSADSDGRTTLGRFQNLADLANIKVRKTIEYGSKISNIAEELEEAKDKLFCRVFILYANSEDSENIFQEIELLNMTDAGYVWLISEQALQAPNRPNGVLALRLNASDEVSMIRDSVSVLSNALRELYLYENITTPPSDCGSVSFNKWESGTKFLKYLKNQTFTGKTGRIAFDDFGDRLLSDYEIINIVDGSEEIVGNYLFSKNSMKMTLLLNINNIVWPGYERTKRSKPIGYVVPTHLKVVTITEKPFVWAKSADINGDCKPKQVVCPKLNATSEQYEKFCCEGYCIDLLKELSLRLNFTYELEQVYDGQYGTFDFADGWDKPKRWTGLVGEIVYKKADMIIAPLSINPLREQVIDFSKPFKYEGITVLQKRQPRKATLASFLQPFQNTLWLLVLISVHVVALALYLLDRFSPFGGFKMDNVVPSDEGALNLSSAIWFSWGVLLNSGIGERTPRSFSARVLGMVWAGFAMIVVASYTANLAAFLVLNPRDDHAVSGIEDSRLRNPAESFKFGTVKGSAVEIFFRSQVELANAYRRMEEHNKKSVEEAIENLLLDELDAFVWDSPRLEYEAAQNCELVTSGEPFGRSGYGIGLQKNSFWTEEITLALLRMHESGYMESLDNKWILASDKECESKHEMFPITLGMKNMAGVFILVFSGIVVSFGLIVIEIVYKKRRARKIRRLAIAKKLAIKWRLRVQKRKVFGTNLYASRIGLQRQLMAHKSHPYFKLSQQFTGDPKSNGDNTVSLSNTDEQNAFSVEKCALDMRSANISKNIQQIGHPNLARDIAFGKSFEYESRSSTPCDSDSQSYGYVIPPPPPPPNVLLQRISPSSFSSLPKRSAQQKIYEYKQRRSLGYD